MSDPFDLDANQYSAKHPHEPEIPPALDDEGRCLVCALTVQVRELKATKEAVTNERDVLAIRAAAAEARARELEAELADWQTEARKYVAEFKRLHERIAELETDDERAREARADYDAWQGRMQKRLARLMGPRP